MQNVYKQIADNLIAWYPEHARDLPWRKDKEPYHVWLSEIMLQQTRVEAVKEYYRTFLQELPTIEALAEVDDDRLMKLSTESEEQSSRLATENLLHEPHSNSQS